MTQLNKIKEIHNCSLLHKFVNLLVLGSTISIILPKEWSKY